MDYEQGQKIDRGLTTANILYLINRATNRKPNKATKTLKGSQSTANTTSNIHAYGVTIQPAVVIDQSGAHSGTYGTITPAPDAATVTFSTSQAFVSGSLEVYKNGTLLKAGTAQDFVETGIPGQFTLAVAPGVADILNASYKTSTNDSRLYIAQIGNLIGSYGSYTTFDLAPNGGRDTFTLQDVPFIAATARVYLDGVLQTEGATNDFTFGANGRSIVFAADPANNKVLSMIYQRYPGYVIAQSAAAGSSYVTLTPAPPQVLGTVYSVPTPYISGSIVVSKNGVELVQGDATHNDWYESDASAGEFILNAATNAEDIIEAMYLPLDIPATGSGAGSTTDLDDAYNNSPSGNKLITVDNGPIELETTTASGTTNFITYTFDGNLVAEQKTAGSWVLYIGQQIIGTLELGDATRQGELVLNDGDGESLTLHFADGSADAELDLSDIPDWTDGYLCKIIAVSPGLWKLERVNPATFSSVLWDRTGTDLAPHTAGDTITTTGAITASEAAVISGDATHTGSLELMDANNHRFILDVPATIVAYNLTVPTTAGTNKYVMISDGSGNLSWATLSGIAGYVAPVNQQSYMAGNATTQTVSALNLVLFYRVPVAKAGTITRAVVDIQSWVPLSTTDTITFTVYKGTGSTGTSWTTNAGSAGTSDSGAISVAFALGETVSIWAQSNATGGLDSIKVQGWSVIVDS